MTVVIPNTALGKSATPNPADFSRISVRAELAQLETSKSHLEAARMSLGYHTRFEKLATMIDTAIAEVAGDIIAADDMLRS